MAKRTLPEDSPPIRTCTAKRTRSENSEASGRNAGDIHLPMLISAYNPPFRQCHLTMLKSLYCAAAISGGDKNTDTTSSAATSQPGDGAIEGTLWNLIEEYLANCKELSFGVVNARKSRAVYETAIQILKNSDNLVGSPIHASSLGTLNTHLAVPSTPMSVRSVTTPLRSVGVGTGAMDVSSPQHRQNLQLQLQSNSWALVSSLLGRKSSAADRKAKILAKPFQPLVSAITEKLKELQGIHKVIVEERHLKEECRSAVLLAEAPTDVSSTTGISVETSRDSSAAKPFIEAGEDDTIARLECKLHLWHLLLHSVQETGKY